MTKTDSQISDLSSAVHSFRNLHHAHYNDGKFFFTLFMFKMFLILYIRRQRVLRQEVREPSTDFLLTYYDNLLTTISLDKSINVSDSYPFPFRPTTCDDFASSANCNSLLYVKNIFPDMCVFWYVHCQCTNMSAFSPNNSRLVFL